MFNIAMLFFTGLQAKTVSFEVVKGAAGYVVYNQSANGKYLVLNNSLQILGNRPMIYNVETKELEYLCGDSEGWADAVSNDGTVAGTFLDRELLLSNGRPIYSACIWKDGELKSLGLNPKFGIDKIVPDEDGGTSFGSSACAITPDGKYVAGYSYINKYTMVPTVWKDGVWEKDFYLDPTKQDSDNPYEANPQGARAWDISDDGQRVCGWTTVNKGHWEGSMWYPALWLSSEASADSYVTSRIDETTYWMYLKRMNSTGTVAVGDKGTIMKDNGDYSFKGSNWLDISDNGILVGTEIYTEESGVMGAYKYLLKYHGIDLNDYSLLTVMNVSPDGNQMSGTVMGYDENYPNGAWFPIVIYLEGDPSPVVPTTVKSAPGNEDQAVTVSWKLPDFNWTPTIYNIYRDGVKVGTSPSAALSFEDKNVPTGKACYHVTASYDFGSGVVESSASKTSCIEILKTGGCYSPKKVLTEIVYNKTVNISWTVPVPNYVDAASTRAAAKITGYNVYKNGVKTATVTETEYTEVITVPNTYQYTITALYEGDCESEASEPVSIKINPIGTCLPPTDVTVESTRNNAVISWALPELQNGITAVGFYVFRNGTQVNQELLTKTLYTDSNLDFGTYSYQVRAFYDNSCESELTATVSCSIGGYNSPIPPTDLSINIAENNKATLNWETPAIGKIETLKWFSGVKEWETGLNDGGTFYVASKWDAEDLNYCFDYSLTNIEFWPTMNIPHTFYVYIDGKKVAEKLVSSVKEQTFNTVKLDEPITVDRGKSLMVAYKVEHQAGERPVGADMWPGNGKGNLMSQDGVTWEDASIYGLTANWAISVRLEPYSVVKSDKGIERINKEVTGYNVFKGDTKLNSETIKTTTYAVDIDKSKDECFSVVACYSNDRVSEKSTPVCTYNECLPAQKLNAKAVAETQVDLTWETPVVSTKYDEFTVQYHTGRKTDAVGFATDVTFIPAIQCTPISYPNFKDLALTKITAFINEECEIALHATQNSVVILSQKVRNVEVGKFNTFTIEDNGVKIDPSKDLFVGLMINATAGSYVLGLDGMPAITNRGDMVSEDGVVFYSMNLGSGGTFDGNWCISATFENRGQASSSVISNPSNLGVITNPFKMEDLRLSGEEPVMIAGGVTNETVVGYDVFRDGVKVNTELISENTYSDNTVAAGTEYTYSVKTLWNTGCYNNDSKSVKIKTTGNGIDDIEGNNISIYPNPAKNVLNVRGDYAGFRILSLSGAVVKEITSNVNAIDVSDLMQGVYFVEILNDTQIVIKHCKIIISK